MPGEEDTKLAFASVEDRDQAYLSLPDEPPPGVDVEVWQEEQDRKAQAILAAEITGDRPSPTEKEPLVEDKKVVSPVETTSGDSDDIVDFTVLGKMKRSDLPENLRNYSNPHEILKQADHARKFANSVDDKIHRYENRIAELEKLSNDVPSLKKQLEDMQSVLETTKSKLSSSTSHDQKTKISIDNRLKDINAKLSVLKEYGSDEAEALHLAVSSMADTFNDTFSELNSVRSEVISGKNRIRELESRIDQVASMADKAEQRRKSDNEQAKAEQALFDLQQNNPELKTSLPLYSKDRKDLETAIVRMTQKVLGRTIKSFDDVNRFVGAFNMKDPSLINLCTREGISPADYGINDTDIRNYGILMDVHWRQQGERIDPITGKLVKVTDFRGNKVTFPDYQSAFQNLKDNIGLSQAERELAVIEAEKKGQSSLEVSLHRRDASSKVIEPTGIPPEGSGMSEDEALEVIGYNISNKTIDEEKMELLLRAGDKRGWAMFRTLQKAHETLKMPIPKEEAHWLQSA